jgi:Ca2+/Na+ antiporter
LPLDIAGVTFLAFGNGAPDVFSSVASFSTAANPMIGVGALLGAGMFVTTVVVGVLCIISDVKISAAAFARDISFLILTLTWVVTVLFLGTVTLMQSLAFLLLYATYVGVAVTMWSCSASHSAADSHSDELPGAVMSAFWHTSTDLHIQEAGQQMVPFVAISNASKTAQYTFLISESDENAFDFDEDVSDDAEGPIAETEPSFRHTLVDDYFATASPESPTALRESLLANEERRELEGRTSSREVRLSSRRKNDSVPGSVLASLYWQRFRCVSAACVRCVAVVESKRVQMAAKVAAKYTNG